MIERSSFIGVLNAKPLTRPHLEANMAIIIEGETSENQTSVFFRALPETSEKMRLQSWYEQGLVSVWRQCVLNIAAKSKLINHYQTHF